MLYSPVQKAAIIELSGDHHECIHSHVKLLSPFHETHVIGGNSIMPHQSAFPEASFYHEIKLPSNGFLRLIKLIQLSLKIRKLRFNIVMVNSLDQRVNQILLKLLPNSIAKYGVLHDASRKDRILKTLTGFFVTNEQLKERFSATKPYRFHPCFFIKPVNPVQKPTDFIRIIIPGGIDPRRRNYEELISILPLLNSNIELIIAGTATTKEGNDIERKLAMAESKCRVQFAVGLTDEQTFLNTIRSSHYILPLMDVEKQKSYLTDKTSGSFNLSVGLEVPLILPEDFKRIAISPDSHTYYKGTLSSSFLNALEPRIREFPSAKEINSEYSGCFE